MNASIIFVVKHHNVFLYFALQSIVVLLIYILLFSFCIYICLQRQLGTDEQLLYYAGSLVML